MSLGVVLSLCSCIRITVLGFPLVSGSGLLQQCQVWALSHGVGLKSNVKKWLVTLITFILSLY